MKGIFLGKLLHWLLWAAIVAVIYLLGSLRLHTRDFNLFAVIVLALAAAAVLLIVYTYKKGRAHHPRPLRGGLRREGSAKRCGARASVLRGSGPHNSRPDPEPRLFF